MKIKQIVEKSDKELVELIAKTQAELAKFRVELRTTKVANIKQAGPLKKTIAQAKTLLREREIAQLEAELDKEKAND